MSKGTQCRCAMCGTKKANANRNSHYRYLPCSERLPRGKDKVRNRRLLRHSAKVNAAINAGRDML